MNAHHPPIGASFVRRVLRWTCLLVLVCATFPARGATDAANVAAIQSNLPADLPLKQASIKQTADALYETILQHHDDASGLLRVAILVKIPRQDDGSLSCEDLRRLVQAACTAATDQTSQFVDQASSLRPGCADDLQELLAVSRGETIRTSDLFGFSVGFGPGLPGVPGFGRATATGNAAITGHLPPPSPTPVTPAGND